MKGKIAAAVIGLVLFALFAVWVENKIEEQDRYWKSKIEQCVRTCAPLDIYRVAENACICDRTKERRIP